MNQPSLHRVRCLSAMHHLHGAQAALRQPGPMTLCHDVAGHREAGRVLGMLMGGDEKDPASAGAGKKKPNVGLLPLRPTDLPSSLACVRMRFTRDLPFFGQARECDANRGG